MCAKFPNFLIHFTLQIGWRPALKPEEIGMLVHAADPKAIGRPALEFLAAQKTEVDAQKTEVDVKA